MKMKVVCSDPRERSAPPPQKGPVALVGESELGYLWSCLRPVDPPAAYSGVFAVRVKKHSGPVASRLERELPYISQPMDFHDL